LMGFTRLRPARLTGKRRARRRAVVHIAGSLHDKSHNHESHQGATGTNRPDTFPCDSPAASPHRGTETPTSRAIDVTSEQTTHPVAVSIRRACARCVSLHTASRIRLSSASRTPGSGVRRGPRQRSARPAAIGTTRGTRQHQGESAAACPTSVGPTAARRAARYLLCQREVSPTPQRLRRGLSGSDPAAHRRSPRKRRRFLCDAHVHCDGVDGGLHPQAHASAGFP
jgi:hypothetical protein